MVLRQLLRGRRGATYCYSWIYEMKVAWMQLRRMHAQERDRIARESEILCDAIH